MKRSLKISTVPETLLYIQSKLWYNDTFKICFSTKHTNNPQEYYCFFFDIRTGLRTHGRYRVTTEAVMVTLPKYEYQIKELTGMRNYDVTMIQFINTDDELDYINWIGANFPVEKGLPYDIATGQKLLSFHNF